MMMMMMMMMMMVISDHDDVDYDDIDDVSVIVDMLPKSYALFHSKILENLSRRQVVIDSDCEGTHAPPFPADKGTSIK